MAAKKTVPKTSPAKTSPAKTSPKPSSKKAAKPTAAKAPKTAVELPALGSKAPAFSLPRDGGDTVALTDFAGKKLVLYFYPRADTSGCTKEAIDFSRLRGEFGRAGAEIVGVSADPVAAQDKFKAKHKLSIALASDEKHRMLEAYGVWQEKSLYGRKFLGIVRTTFLIDADGRIAKVWPRVSVAGHAEDVLAAAKAL
jgi:thioredoxin-dependent peroxiredoxin